MSYEYFLCLVPVAVLAAVGYAILCFRRPLWGFSVLLFLQLYDQLLILVPAANKNAQSLVNTLTVPKIMFLVLLVFFAIRTLLSKSERPLQAVRAQKLYILLCVTFLLTCVPCMLKVGLGGWAYTMRLGNAMALSFLTIMLVVDFRSLRILSVAMIAGNIGVAIIGLYEALTKTYVLEVLRGIELEPGFHQAVETGEGFRVAGPCGDPSYFSIEMMLGMVACLIVLLGTRRRLVRLACLASTALFVVAIIPTASKGGIFSCAIMGGLYFMLAKMRHKWFWATTALTASIGSLLVYSLAVDPTPVLRLSGQGGSDITTRYRIGFMEQALRMIEEQPFTGLGMGQFASQQKHYFEAATPRVRQDPSNVYLQIFTESGLASLVVYLAIVGLCCLHPVLRILRAEDFLERNVAAAILGGIVGLAFMGATGNMREFEYAWVLLTFGILIKNFHYSAEETTG